MVTGRVTNISAYKSDYKSVGFQLDNSVWYNVAGTMEECNAKTAGFTVGDTVEFGFELKGKGKYVNTDIKLVTTTVGTAYSEGKDASLVPLTTADKLPAESRSEVLARCLRDAEKAYQLAELKEILPECVSRSANMFYIGETKKWK